MNERDELWEAEFASLAEEDFKEQSDRQQKRCSFGLAIILCTLLIFIIGCASIASIIFGTPAISWDSTIIIQGSLFFGGFFLLLACIYLLEGEERI